MRVLHVIKDLEPGGIQQLLVDMLASKKTFAGEMALFAMGQGGYARTFKALASPFFYESQRKWPIDIRVVSDLRKAVAHFKPDVVHTHHTVEMLHAWLALKNNSKVMKAHTYHVSVNVNTITDNLLSKFLEKRFDLLLTPSAALKNQMIEKGYSKAAGYCVLPNGVSTERVISNLSKAECRFRLGIPQNVHAIGMAGTFYNQIRDQATLCKAFTKLTDLPEETVLLFAGASQSHYFNSSSMLRKCQRILTENNLMHKAYFLPHMDAVGLFYGALDVYVHSSLNDTFGLAPVEAYMNGLPIITSDLPVFREVFSDADMLFFPAKDAERLAALLRQFIVEKNNKETDGLVRPKSCLIQKYNMNTHIESLHKAYTQYL